MCISATVGFGGRNTTADVRALQLLLNMNSGQGGFVCKLATDGAWGSGTAAALDTFRHGVGVPVGKPVAPQDPTMMALRRGLPAGLVPPKLGAIMAEATSVRVDAFYTAIRDVLARYQMNTPLRIAHFLAQIAHESGCLRYTEEIASGDAYEGRKDLGNTQPGDGRLYKGRGLIQLTGRANYRQYGATCQRDFERRDAPGLVSTDPHLAVDVAGWFWSSRKLNELADADDLQTITRRINGGLNGFDQRAAFLLRAKWLLL